MLRFLDVKQGPRGENRWSGCQCQRTGLCTRGVCGPGHCPSASDPASAWSDSIVSRAGEYHQTYFSIFLVLETKPRHVVPCFKNGVVETAGDECLRRRRIAPWRPGAATPPYHTRAVIWGRISGVEPRHRLEAPSPGAEACVTWDASRVASLHVATALRRARVVHEFFTTTSRFERDADLQPSYIATATPVDLLTNEAHDPHRVKQA